MLELITALLLIACGVLAASSLVVARRSDARRMLNDVLPFEGALGVALMLTSALYLLTSFSLLRAIRYMSSLFAFTFYASLLTAFALGFLLGMPLLAKWLPSASPAQRAMAMQRKLAAYETPVGVVGVVTGGLLLLFHLHLLRAV